MHVTGLHESSDLFHAIQAHRSKPASRQVIILPALNDDIERLIYPSASPSVEPIACGPATTGVAGKLWPLYTSQSQANRGKSRTWCSELRECFCVMCCEREGSILS